MRLRKYGVVTTIDFPVYGITGVDLKTDWVPAAADCEIMKDGGASTQCTNTATDEGATYSIVLTATEMQAARLVLKIVDAATKVFLDTVVIIETYGNAAAQHAFDFDTASVAQSADNDTKISTLITGVDLNADAIKATSYDESTAFPLTAVNGSTLTEAGGTGDHLTAINLPNQTMDITGSLSGSVGSVTGAVGSVTAVVTTDAASRTASQADVSDIPTNAEFNARTLPTADYTIVSDLGTVQTADHTSSIADIPTVSEFNARTIPAADYFDPAADTVANVTLVDTTTTNTDMISVASVTTGCNASLNATIPGSPVADSVNDYIQRMKFVMVNKIEITEANGNTTIYKDNDSTVYATILAAYTSDATTTTRKRLE